MSKKASIVKVVGLSFRPTKTKLKAGDKVRLVKEPENQYDPNAVRVETLNEVAIGYIGKDDPYRDVVLNGSEPAVYLPIIRANYHQKGDDKLWPKVEEGDLVQLWLRGYEDADQGDPTYKQVVSFTKDAVLWSEFHHKCLDLKGNVLVGGSTYASEASGGKFDSSSIAAKYGADRGLTQEQVQEFWDSLRDIAGDYGTAIHVAMEHYAKYEPIFGHDLALPRQPHTRMAVEKFLEVSNMKRCVPEPLITDTVKGMSGWIDLLRLHDDKTVSVEDYKTNQATGSKWKKKLKEYEAQLNYYGTILENHGFTVSGCVVWHWINEKWERHDMQFNKIKEYAR